MVDTGAAAVTLWLAEMTSKPIQPRQAVFHFNHPELAD